MSRILAAIGISLLDTPEASLRHKQPYKFLPVQYKLKFDKLFVQPIRVQSGKTVIAQ